MQEKDFINGLSEYINGLENEKSKSVLSEQEKEEEVKVEGLDEIEGENAYLSFELSNEELEENNEELALDKYIGGDETEKEKEETAEEVKDEESNDNYEENEHIDFKDLLGNSNDIDNDLDEEDEEKGILDVNNPDLYSSDTNDNVSFEELNTNSKVEDEDDFDFPVKQKYDEVTGGKKKFEPGKLNKNNLLIAICGFIGVILLGFMWATRQQEIKKKDKGSKDNNVYVTDYTPEFGNYKERAYKPPVKEEEEGEIKTEEEAIQKLNEIADNAAKKGKYENPNQTKTESTPSQSQSVYVQQDDTYAKRVGSSLRKNISGENNVSYFPQGNTEGYNASFLPQGVNGSNGYFEQLGQITNALKPGGQSGNPIQNSNSLRFSDAGKYNPDASGGDSMALPSNSIYPGTIIPAVLVSGINTDYPGTITARVMSNVYDSRTGTKLLIPQGSILRGSYSSSSIGIKSIQIAWQTLIINRDGRDYIVNLGSMVGVDSKGFSGIAGSLNDHYFAYLKAAGLSALFTYINNSVYSVTQSQKNKVTAEMISGSQEIGNKLTDKLLDRALDINPTVTVKGGTKINVDVDKVLTLQPYDRDIPVQRYKR